MSGSPNDQTMRVLGLSIVSDCIELHGLNQLGEVVLHGWFPHETGVLILCRQANCMIALSVHSAPEHFAETLEALGHSTILVHGIENEVQPRESAKALAQIALSAICRPSTAHLPMALRAIPLN